MVLRGQIIGHAPADAFSIHDSSGVELVGIQFGQADAQEVVTLSGGETAFRIGFQVYLPMPGGEEIRISDMWVRARSRDGSVFEEGMRLGCMGDRAAILAGPAHDMAGLVLPEPRGMVYLETAEIGTDGRLRAHGWTLAMSPIVAVQIFVDGQRVGAAIQGRDRGDVAEAYPRYANARHPGFVLDKASATPCSGSGRVTAQVLCLSGACLSTTIPLERSGAKPGDARPRPSAAMSGGGDLPQAKPITANPIQADAVATAAGPVTAGPVLEGPISEGPITADPAGAGQAPVGQVPVGQVPLGPAQMGQVPVGQVQMGPAQMGQAQMEQARAEPAAADGGTPRPATEPPPPATGLDLGRAILLICDHATITASGVLLVEGWAACGQGIESVAIEVDGVPAGDAAYGRERADVAERVSRHAG